MLPDEILIQIFSKCDIISLLNLNLTCKKFHNLIKDDLLWKKNYNKTFLEYKQIFLKEYNLFNNWNQLKCYHYLNPFYGYIRSIVCKNNKVYVGTQNGKIACYLPINNRIIHIDHSNHEQIVAIDADEKLLVAGSGSPYWINYLHVTTISIINFYDSETLELIYTYNSELFINVIDIKIGKNVITIATKNGMIKILSKSTFEILHSFIHEKIENIQFFDENTLISSGGIFLIFWDINTGNKNYYSFSNNKIGKIFVYEKKIGIQIFDKIVFYTFLNKQLNFLNEIQLNYSNIIKFEFDDKKLIVLNEKPEINVYFLKQNKLLYSISNISQFSSTFCFNERFLFHDGFGNLLPVYDMEYEIEKSSIDIEKTKIEYTKRNFFIDFYNE